MSVKQGVNKSDILFLVADLDIFAYVEISMNLSWNILESLKLLKLGFSNLFTKVQKCRDSKENKLTIK